MYLKLFAVMTVFWCLEIVSHFVDVGEFFISDIFNCLQGFIIFMIFVMKKETRELIVKRYNNWRGYPSDQQEPKNNIEENEIGGFQSL